MKKCCYHKRTLAVLILLFSTSISFAQHDFSKVDKWLTKNTEEMGGRSVLMIYEDGEVVYSKAVNNMNRRQKWVNAQIAKRMGPSATVTDFNTNTRQMIASCSKWLSAALVMTFVDQGKLSTADTVGKYLPILSQHGKGSITLGQCLSHLTGIQAPPIREELRELRNMGTMDEEILRIARLPMEGEPGKVFHYSNIGLQIAGAVIEKISGKSFEMLFAERIAKPLNMKNTDFGRGKTVLPAGGAR